jgi:hypothetical protein
LRLIHAATKPFFKQPAWYNQPSFPLPKLKKAGMQAKKAKKSQKKAKKDEKSQRKAKKEPGISHARRE